MGWLKIGYRNSQHQGALSIDDGDSKYLTQHIEDIKLAGDAQERLSFAPDSVSDADLPFLNASEVAERKSKETGGLCIVVDKVVYDCTEFIEEHPGGLQVIKSFAGAECSWQFWRFHGKKDMEEFGKPLRVARTEGMKNKFKEPQKYVGLRSRGQDDW